MKIVTIPDILSRVTSINVRHFSLPGVGHAGQSLLKKAKVLIIGAGGLGAPVSMYLAASGVGTLGLADSDGLC